MNRIAKLANTTAKMPEQGRLIKCQGHDWSAFTCEGIFLPYKPIKGKPQNRSPRFCTKNRAGEWETDRATWKDVETWEYVEVPHDSQR